MFYMKNITEIPECKKIIDKMLDEINQLPNPTGLDTNYIAEKKIKDKYFPLIFKAKERYKRLHPEEFEDKK